MATRLGPLLHPIKWRKSNPRLNTSLDEQWGHRQVPNVYTLNHNPYGSNSFLLLQGYYSLNDGGGGTLVAAGLNGCNETALGSSWSSGSTLISITNTPPLPSNISIGMPISGTGIQLGTKVVSFAVTSSNSATISISLITTGSGAGATLSGDNGGTIFNDSAGYCFERISQSFNQVEWGAHTNGTDDTAALQNWLNAEQPHVAVPGTSLISQPLVCSNPNGWSNYNGTLEGAPTANAEDGTILPSFVITAGSSFPNVANTAMLEMMVSNCSVSGVGLIGSNAPGTLYDIIDMGAKSDSVFNHSYLYGGYNAFSCDLGKGGGNPEVYDSTILRPLNYGLFINCPNGKFQRNVISTAGADNVYYAGSQGLVQGNVIEEATENGVNCSAGALLGLVGNYFDNNGKNTPPILPVGQNLFISNCQSVSVSGNQFHRSNPGGEEFAPTTDTAHVVLSGINDSISLAGNAYYVGNSSSDLPMRPDYDVEFASTSAPPAVITNLNIADALTPQNKGVFGPNASPVIGALQVSEPQNFLTGLIGSNVGSSATLSLSAGEAMDSLNLQLLNLPAGCQVNLDNGGAGGLDTGVGTILPNTQYNFFVFAQGSYGSAPTCIATRAPAAPNPPTPPNFLAAFPPTAVCSNSPPPYTVKLTASVNAGSTVALNVMSTAASGNTNLNPLAGLAVGDVVADCTNNGYITTTPLPTTITSLSSSYVTFQGTASGTQITGLIPATAINNLYAGETLGNADSSNLIPSGTVITQVVSTGTSPCTAPCLVTNNPLTSGTGYIAAGTNFTIQLSQPVNSSCTASPCSDTLYIYNERFRMVAAQYTNTASNIFGFTQDGDTIYFGTPTLGYNGTVNTLTTPIQLPSMPAGISVEAFGRCVAGGGHVLLYSPGVSAVVPPRAFPNPPAYAMFNALTASTVAFPFRAYTDKAQTINAQADVSGTLQCVTDGWKWDRAR